MNLQDLKFDRCCITGYKFSGNEVKPVTSSVLEYSTPFVGNVKVELSVYVEMLNDGSLFPRDILSGITKNRTLNGEEPLIFTHELCILVNHNQAFKWNSLLPTLTKYY